MIDLDALAGREIMALSLTQPWATLLCLGEKRQETRSWGPSYRGLVALHAAKGFPEEAKQLLGQEPFSGRLLHHGVRSSGQLRVGCVLAVARLVDVVPTRTLGGLPHPRVPPTDTAEFAFGDYGPDRYIWVFEDVTILPASVAASGRLGLWRWRVPAFVRQLDPPEARVAI